MRVSIPVRKVMNQEGREKRGAGQVVSIPVRKVMNS